MFRTTIRSAGAVALLASGALLLSGCSSSGSSSSSAAASPSASASGSADRKQQMAAFTDCLRQHGVTLPSGRPSGRPSESPGAGGGGTGGGGGGFMGGASMDPARKAAMDACASLRPQGGQGRGGGNSTAMQAFIGCMKDHGVTVPATGGMRALNTADPATAAAFKICQPLIPARGSADPSASGEATATATAGATS